MSQPRTTTLQPGRCFYLHLDEGEDTHNDLVLSADSEDFKDSWPARYTFLEHQVYDDMAQQWFFNEKDGSIHNNATPSYMLQNDKGELQVGNVGSTDAKVSPAFPKKAGVWHWDGPSK